MENTYLWKAVPQNLPSVLRYCPKCGCISEFESSRNFRVNANKNSLDIWLIYKCRKCNTTWNMSIISKADCKTIDKEFYRKCIDNDRELADYYAFDTGIHNKNKTVCNYENVTYHIIGNDIRIEDIREAVHIRLECNYPARIRLDKILSQKLCVSRNIIKEMMNSGGIRCEGFERIDKIRLGNVLFITIQSCDEAVRNIKKQSACGEGGYYL